MTYSSLPPHIAAAFDPKLFRAAGERLVAQLSSHLEQVESGQSPVLPWVNPADQVTAASEWMHQYDFSESRLGNQDVSCLVDRFAEIVQIALDPQIQFQRAPQASFFLLMRHVTTILVVRNSLDFCLGQKTLLVFDGEELEVYPGIL